MPRAQATGPESKGGDGEEMVRHVAEQVRRIAARSREDRVAFALEYELYRAVLALIAQGAPAAAMLAETALQSQNYGFERST
jgi:hypothetical protein